METEKITDAKICILICPFEPPKPKIKHKLNITSKETYDKPYRQEQNYFKEMVMQVKDCGVNDDEANRLLL